MSKGKAPLVQMRVYLPGAELDRAKRIAEKRGVSVSTLVSEWLWSHRSRGIGTIKLPVGRADWHIVSVMIERELREVLHARADKLGVRSWDLISAILLAAIPKR